SAKAGPAAMADTAPGAGADGWLLDDFAVGDIFFASPALQHRAWGKEGIVASHEPATPPAVAALFERARERGIGDPVMFGLVPFDASRPASLGIPVRRRSLPVPEHKAEARAVGERPAIVAREPVPAPEVYGEIG